MLWKRQTQSTNIYLVAVLLVFHLTQTETSPLKKTTAGQNGQEKATDTLTGFRPGVIVFGKGLKNASVQDNTAYQADFPGLPKGHVFDMGAKEHQFKHMSPSLLCGHNHMRFRAVGAPVRHFGLNQYPHLPLSHVPSACGYHVQRSPFGLVMQVPYDGCNIVTEDGNYNLPLHWNGIPVTLKCPKPDDGSSTISPFFPWFPGMPKAPTTAAPQIPQGLLQHPFMYQWPTLFSTPATPPQDPVPHFHKSLWPYYFSHWHQLAQTTTPSPQDPVPQIPSNYWEYLYYMHKMFPYPSQAAPTTSPQDPANYWQWQHPHGQLPQWQHPHGQLPQWQHPHGQLPQWQHPHGQLPQWQHPHGQLPQWQHPHGQLPQWQHPHGQLPQWQHPHGQLPQWQHPHGQLPVVPTQSGQVPWFGQKWWFLTTTSPTTPTAVTTTTGTTLPQWMG